MELFKESISPLNNQEKSEPNHWFGQDMVRNQDWKGKMLPALRKHDYQTFKILKEKYLSDYPKEQEAIEAFFDSLAAFSSQKQLRYNHHLTRNERKNKIKQLTEFEYLLTHFLVNNQNQQVLKDFWKEMREMAKVAGKEQEYKSMKQGILGQVAIFLSLKKCGLTPQLAHPSLDMLDKIDIQIYKQSSQEKEIDVQIKSSRKLSTPELFASSTVYYGSIEAQNPQNQGKYINLIDHHFAQENKEFRVAIEKYKKQTNKDVEAFLVVIPASEMDNSTGQPSDSFVNFLSQHLDPSIDEDRESGNRIH